MDIETFDRSIPVAVVVPTGRLDAISAPDLRTRCDHILDSETGRLVVDLRSVEFCDSAGLAALVGAMKRARSSGGDTKLVAADDAPVWRILELTRFDRVFDVQPDVDQAIKAFAT